LTGDRTYEFFGRALSLSAAELLIASKWSWCPVCSSWRMMLRMRHRWAWASLWKCTYPGSGGTTEHMYADDLGVDLHMSYSLTGRRERRCRWWGPVGKLVLALFTLLVTNPKLVAD